MAKKWAVILILASAQFVMVLDSTVMNVSLDTVARDLGTSVSGMQAAITFYTLTMAALMLTGGKFGDIWGRRGALTVGSVVYGIGSFITGVSPNLAVLMFGWSFVEGLGAVLVIPAIAALAAINYEGRDRVTAFAIIGAVSGAAAAAGPLIGGFVTTYLSWRYVFIAETIIMAIILLFIRKIADEPVVQKAKIDLLSVLLSAFGMGILVFGILQSKEWGWVQPSGAPTINGEPFTPFGVSVVAYMILLGIVLLSWFYLRQAKLERRGAPALLKVSLLSIRPLRSGLSVLLSQYLVIAAIFFVVPVYLQIILGYDALKTGLKILPLSVALVLASLAGTRLVARFAPRFVVRVGQVLLVLGILLLMASINAELKGFLFGFGMFVTGAGLGLLASQLGNVNMSAAGEGNAAEGGGLQGTFQNFGSSFGTAFIGSIFISSLSSGFLASVQQSTLPPNIKNYIASNTKPSIQVVSAQSVNEYAESQGLSPQDASEVSGIYTNAQIQGLKQALFYLAAVALLSLFASRGIPRQKPPAQKSKSGPVGA
ncbi:MAG TPA: MFS transporter [Candidatus Pristimantibacillus sp.]|jgi:MFS family permease|nr:MFS transporter [Candidatus Pristimantibacillus sp.]